MPEVIFNGPEGRLEGRFHSAARPEAPVALLLHPNPQQGGSMNNKIIFNLYQRLQRRGFSVMRFNFRGVGRSQGAHDRGEGELSDAASALDWLQTVNTSARSCWVAGYSFGAWIGMQLLMRRPEIAGFVSIAPPASIYDFSFLAPCPSSGLMINGSADKVIPPESVTKLVKKLSQQRDIVVDHQVIDGANHYFSDHLADLVNQVDDYLMRAVKATVAAAE